MGAGNPDRYRLDAGKKDVRLYQAGRCDWGPDRAGRIDVVMLDKLVAENAVEDGGVKIAATGLDRQSYALAMPIGSAGLQAQINKALVELQNDGTIAALAKKYLGLAPDDIPPVPTPEPATPTPAPAAATATPKPPAGCTDGMAWVADLNLDDKNMTAPPVIPPGQAFTKSWRIKNTGTCTWDSTYYARLRAGQHTGGADGRAAHPCPGAPSLPAPPTTCRSTWWPRSSPASIRASGRWSTARAHPSASASTSASPCRPRPPSHPSPRRRQPPAFRSRSTPPTSPPASALPSPGMSRTPRPVYFYALGQPWQQNGVPGVGQSVQCPPVTTTYELRVVQSNGAVVLNQITINVTQSVTAPQITPLHGHTGEPDHARPVRRHPVAGTGFDQQCGHRAATTADLWNNAPLRGNLADCPPSTGSFHLQHRTPPVPAASAAPKRPSMSFPPPPPPQCPLRRRKPP